MNLPRIRLILAFIFLIIGIILTLVNGFSTSVYLFLAAAFLIFTHYKFGAVWPAFQLLQEGKIEEADNILQQIKKPEWLSKMHRSYFHFTKGMIHVQRKQLPPGAVHLKAALQLGLRNSTDNALAAINLAHIYYVEKNPEVCKKYLQKAIDFNSNDLMIKENIDKLQKALV